MVVKPDMASKKPSLAFSGVAQSIMGSMPNSENTIHATEASSRPSRRCSFLLWGLMRKLSAAPAATVTPMVMAKACQSLSWLKRQVSKGRSMKAASTIMSCPRMRAIIA